MSYLTKLVSLDLVQFQIWDNLIIGKVRVPTHVPPFDSFPPNLRCQSRIKKSPQRTE